MDQDPANNSKEILARAENVQVAVLEQSGLDGLAAGLAIYLSCTKLGKNVSIVAKSPTVGQALKLYGVDKIGQGASSQNLVVVVDNAIENVDKVTYFLEGDKLKIVVHPFPGSKGVSRDQINLEDTTFKADLVFAVGFEISEQLTKMITHEQNLDPKIPVIAINSGELNHKFAQSHIVDPEASSLCEVTSQALQDLALPLDQDIAYNLYTGIQESTSGFLPGVTSPKTLEVAAWLLKTGAGQASLASSNKSPTRFAPIDFPPQNFAPRGNSAVFPGQKFPQSFPDLTNIESVEPEKIKEDDWLKPPKVYQGSKSFDKKG